MVGSLAVLPHFSEGITMSAAKKREFMLGGFMIVASIVYLLMANDLPHRSIGIVTASFVPEVLGTIMFVLGVMQLRNARKLPDTSATKKDAEKENVDYSTVGKTVALIASFAALMPFIGFPIMAVIYLFLQFIVLTPGNRKPNYPLYGFISVIASAAIFLTFRYVFDLMLPTGLLG